MNRRIQDSGDAWNALFNDIEAIERESGGVISLAAGNLGPGLTFNYHGNRKVKTASVIKLPILVHVAMAVREGALSWEEKLTLTEEEKVGGSGILTQMTAGLSLSLHDVCTLMTIVSDNTATNMIIERIGMDPVNTRMWEFGLKSTRLFRKAYSPDTPQSAKYGLGVTTPNDMLRLLTLIAKDKIGDAKLCADIRSILAEQQYRDSIPRFLPTDWKYAGKTGGIDHVRNDVGLVTLPDGRRFALALFCQEIPTVLWTAENAGLLALAKLSRCILTHWTG